MPHLELTFLGTFQIIRDGRPVPRFRVNAARALLAYLAVEADRPHRRETLAGLLWPEVPDATALKYLRHTLSELRKAIGDDDHTAFLHITRSTLQFNLDRSASAWLDVAAFMRGAHSPTLSDLEQAAALYRGPFLVGFSLEGSPAFEEWLLVWQQQLARLAIDVLYRAATQRAEGGDSGKAIAQAQQLLTIEPLHEAALRLLMQLLVQAGRRTEALAHYETYGHTLAHELNIQPSPELIAEHDRIRAGLWLPTVWTPTLWTPTPRSEPAASAAPRHTFVAREHELARLDRALARVRCGQGGLVFVTGGAGSGKTALLAEFMQRALNAYQDVLPAGGLCSAQMGSGDPYLPFRDILRLLTGDIEAKRAGGTLSPDHARRLWAVLPDTLQALVEQSPDLIGSFVNAQTLLLCAEALTSLHAPWRTRLSALIQRSAPALPTNLWQQITAILTASAQARPLLLIIDDAQWADDKTIGLLFHLGRLLPARMLIVVAYRSGDVALGRAGQRHPLEPLIHEVQRATGEPPIDLDATEGRAFIDALLDAEPNRLDGQFRETLYQRTNGQALFTVELLHDLQARGDLVRDDAGCWAVSATLNWQRLPARIEAVIAEHLARVPEHWRTLLQAACVEGEEFTAGVVAEAIGLAEADVVRALSGELSQRYQLIMATRVEHIGVQRWLRYRFRHALFETYLYQQLDAVLRTQLHEAIGTALEKRYANRPTELAEVTLRLAWQFEAAGLKWKAASYGLLAGQRATRLSAHQEASRWLKHSLTLLADVPDSLERARLETKLQLSLGAALLDQGWGAPERERALERALELARHTGATIERLVALHLLADSAQGRGKAIEAVALSQELLQLAEQTGQASFLALAHYSLGSSQLMCGKLSPARAHLAQALEFDDAAGQTHVPLTGAEVKITSLAWLIVATWLLGDSATAEAYIAQVLQHAQPSDHAFSLGIALVSGVCPYWLWLGRPAEDQARRYIDQLSRLAEGGAPLLQAWVKVFDGYWHARRGELNGIAQLQHGIAEWTTTGSRGGYVYQRLLLIEVCLAAGQNEEAQRAATEAQVFIAQSGYQIYEAELHRWRGELANVRGDASEARACFQRALEVARAQGAVTWVQRAALNLEQLRP